MSQPRDDDLDWFEHLAGRPVDGGAAATRSEAAWLRAALLSYPATVPAGVDRDPAARADALVARAVRAGLLDAATPQPQASAAPLRRAGPSGLAAWVRRWSAVWRSGWAWGGVLASAVLLALLVARPDDPPTDARDAGPWRGAPVWTMPAADAADAVAARDRWQQRLAAAGLPATALQRLGRPALDISLPPAPTPAQAALLRELGTTEPWPPAVILEFAPSPPR